MNVTSVVPGNFITHAITSTKIRRVVKAISHGKYIGAQTQPESQHPRLFLIFEKCQSKIDYHFFLLGDLELSLTTLMVQETVTQNNAPSFLKYFLYISFLHFSGFILVIM